ncbi:hypothetical protein HAX54_023216 [Datura stramonium]|uniref:Uncharacterized protein n=1 Tax=Datura stramonium TaxID=4076 RepID=A0ABS8UVZ8_DATST|nr:hypothetical protein [Datura stramonium]
MTMKRKASKAITRRKLIDETSVSEARQVGNSPSGSVEDYQVDTSNTDGTRTTRARARAKAQEATATSAQAPQFEEGAREGEFYINLPIMDWSLPNPVAYVRGVQISISVASSNKALGLPNLSETDLKAKDVEVNEWWLMVSLVVEERKASSHWGITHTGIRGTHFQIETRRWPNIVSQRSLPSTNVTDL